MFRQMEKLIELLNEYKKIKGYDGNTKIINYDTDTGSFTNGYSGLEYETVIGKRYGFIKWLVENDKIDLEKIKKWNLVPLDASLRHIVDDTEKNNVCRLRTTKLLMLLSISDEPINFLISILK